ncbi:MAG: tetratricopeptide repeat protein [Candidatus Cloacimonas sp.]|jgi:tetratricopeptide (TPR) repeat protein|nr:tetratricopeptide repeat protein [Candidatus Cloacimonadota bacterium]
MLVTVFPLVIIVLIIVVFIIGRTLRTKSRAVRQRGYSEPEITTDDLWLEMARSYEKSGDVEKALEHYELYIFKKRPNNPEIYFHVGNLFGKESLKEATDYWQQAADMGYQPAIEALEEFEITD